MLIIVCGLPGSGKTTLSGEISGKIDGVLLSTDKIRKEIFEKRTYSDREKEIVYQKMEEQAETGLKNNRNVIVDGTFYRRELRERFIQLSKKLNKEYYIICCFLEEGKTKERMEKRKNDKSEADFGVYKKIKEAFEKIEGEYLEIDTSKEVGKQSDEVLFYILKEQFRKSYEFIETHISLIFLDKEFAYKIKKPVKFSFLDFSTKEKRKFYLEEELRLNGRISDIYLWVEEVNFNGDKFSIGKEGKAFEYALKMKRMRQEQKMDHLVEKGMVSFEDIKTIAKKISDFHAKAKIIEDRKYNSSEMLKEQIGDLGNFKKGIIDACNMGNEVGFIIEKCSRYIDKNKELFEKRQKTGKIRECHGDLHTGNIFLDGKPIIFDCIEFNEEFRFIDTLSDVGFLAMDLDAKGRADLSDFLIEEYAKYCKDSDAKKLVDLYKCYRANVRAKIAAIEYMQNKSEDARKRIGRYLVLAEGYAKKLV